MVMKNTIATTTLLSALVALVCLNPQAVAQSKFHQRCSNATVAGKYGFTANGSLIGIGAVAATGISSFDGKGNLSGSQTRSVNGDVADETFQGTYSVNSDCKGTELVQVYQSGQLVRTTTLQTVIEDNGNGGSGIFSKIELPDGTLLPSVLTFEAKRLFPRDDD
jgi:hypothetical protein